MSDRDNTLACMRVSVRQVAEDRRLDLTPEALERAVEFAADQWRGQTNAGQAARAGVDHVTAGVIRRRE